MIKIEKYIWVDALEMSSAKNIKMFFYISDLHWSIVGIQCHFNYRNNKKWVHLTLLKHFNFKEVYIQQTFCELIFFIYVNNNQHSKICMFWYYTQAKYFGIKVSIKNLNQHYDSHISGVTQFEITGII